MPADYQGAESSGEETSLDSDDETSKVRKQPDSWLTTERVSGERLPVEYARLYNSKVMPVPLPSGKLKLVVLPIFWVVCIYWHMFQHHMQLQWGWPGQDGQKLVFQRTLPGWLQVTINIVLVVVLCTYGTCCYLFHAKILDKVLNHLFIPRTWILHMVASFVFFTIAMFSSFFLTKNWVPAAAGLFMFFGYAVVGRSVQETSSSRGQIALGPSRAPADVGASYHVDGKDPSAGAAVGVPGFILAGDARRKTDRAEDDLVFVSLEPSPCGMSDDACVARRLPDGSLEYVGPCGRANIFRIDCLIILLASFGVHLPQFVIGGGGFNQCAGLTELIVSLIYVPIGYTCFAVFGFRVGLANSWSMLVVLGYCLWPFINLVLGGKGCATLQDLIRGHFLPQIWDPKAETFIFHRGYAECSQTAYDIGGESLLVASTCIAAWVHIMSNFSFLFGFISGMLRMKSCWKKVERDVVVT